MKKIFKLKNFGLITYLISVTGILLCIAIYPSWSSNSNFVISDFGVIMETRILFSSSLIVSSILYFIFMNYFLGKYEIKNEQILRLIFSFSAFGLFLLSIINYETSRLIHWFGATSFFLLNALGIFLLGYFTFLKKSKFINPSKNIFLLIKKRIGFIYIIVGISQFFIILFGFEYIKPFGIAQIIYIVLQGFWIISLSIFYRK